MSRRLIHFCAIVGAAALAIAVDNLPLERVDRADSLDFRGIVPMIGEEAAPPVDDLLVARDLATRRLFIAGHRSRSLTVFDLDSGLPVELLPVGEAPVALEFDPTFSRLYVLGADGVLSVIAEEEPDSYRLLDSICLHHEGRGLLLNPHTHRLHVLLGRRADRAAVFDAVTQRRRA